MGKEGKKRFVRILGAMLLAFCLGTSLFSLAIAYAGGVRGVGLLGIWFFLTLGIVVVLSQLIPGGILLSSFIESRLSSFRKKGLPIRMA